jgi:hypothetical protein
MDGLASKYQSIFSRYICKSRCDFDSREKKVDQSCCRFVGTSRDTRDWQRARDFLTVKDGVRNLILHDKRLPVMPYATEQRRRRWLERFKCGGFDGPLNYYRAATFDTQHKAHIAILPPPFTKPTSTCERGFSRLISHTKKDSPSYH